MLTKIQIKEIFSNELKRFGLDAKVKFLGNKQFKNKALLSPIIAQSLKEGNSLDELNIPALVSHKTNTLYFSKATLNRLLEGEPLSIQIRFVKSVVLHEMFHLMHKYDSVDFNSSLRSEEEASMEFSKNYPGLAALGRRICKKYISD